MQNNCACYQDFLGEAISETYRTGKLKKPNTENKLYKNRSLFRQKMEKDAQDQNRPLEDVALDYVNQNSGQIAKYVLSNGEVPFDENPVQLAMQAYRIRKNEVENIAQMLGSDLTTAEAYLDDAENNAIEINSPEADSFIGELFDAIANAASPAIQRAADKHKAKTGKAGFIGGLASVFKSNSGVQDQAAQAGNDALDRIEAGKLGDLAKGALDAIKNQQKQKEIKKMLPAIIIGVVALIIVVVVLTKATSKK